MKSSDLMQILMRFSFVSICDSTIDIDRHISELKHMLVALEVVDIYRAGRDRSTMETSKVQEQM